MREIRFRAKILEGYGWDHHQKWVYGFLAKGPLTMENGPAQHFGGDKEEWYIIDEDVVWIVDPETIGEFTGRVDRNGKEIYDGDILTYGEIEFEVGWDEYEFAFGPDLLKCTDIVVIGNIYDNPRK